MTLRAPVGAFLALIGAAAAAAGAFLPWAHVTIVGHPIVGRTATIEPAGWNGDGNVVFGLGVAAALAGCLLMVRDEGRAGTVLRSLILAFGIAVVLVTFWDTTHVSDRFHHVAQAVANDLRLSRTAPRVHTRITYGIVIAAAGGVLMVFAAVVDRFLVPVVVVVEDD
ncbi:MAG: hypothetical protein ACYDCQ_12770 [Dehalococcoidia bacterium]